MFRSSSGDGGLRSFSWGTKFPVAWPETPPLYIQYTSGQDAVVIDSDDSELPGGRFLFYASLIFSGDGTDIMNSNPYFSIALIFNGIESDSRGDLELATALANRIASSNLSSPPILVYSLPTT
jgi:hypothetical protein